MATPLGAHTPAQARLRASLRELGFAPVPPQDRLETFHHALKGCTLQLLPGEAARAFTSGGSETTISRRLFSSRKRTPDGRIDELLGNLEDFLGTIS